MPTIDDYVNQLKSDRSDLVSNLETMGVTGLEGDETFTELVPRVLTIPSGGGQVIQYDEVPIASEEYENQIIQYTGATGTYTKGYFYICLSDGQAIPSYDWTQINVQGIIPPTSVTYSATTVTVNNLTGNYSLKMGEITSLTVNTATASDLETIIYFTSGALGTDISIPDNITNLGDAPTFTTASNINTGTTESNKHYIISIINNIAIWKAY